MINQKNKELTLDILQKYPKLSKFTSLNPVNPTDERFEQVIDGFFEGLNFTTKNPETLNELLEIINEKSNNSQKTNSSISGIITSGPVVIKYNIGHNGLNITTSSMDGKEKSLGMIVKYDSSRFGETLVISYGEIPENPHQFANGITTKEHGGTTSISFGPNGEIEDFDQMLARDKRENLEIAPPVQSKPSNDDLADFYDANRDLLELLSGRN